MQSDNIYIQQLTESLRALDPYLVLLYGSYAYGIPHEDSDIDLLVVTNDDFIPNDYYEHTQLYLKVSKTIREIKKQIAIDLIVHTLPMYKLFLKQNSSFGNEVISKGKILYKRNNTTMA